MINFRPAKIRDIKQIQQIEKEYYEGFSCSEETLKSWIEPLAENFIIAEENGKIIGFIFFEFLDEVKAIPFIHDTKTTNNPKGSYVYITELGIIDSHVDLIQELFDKVVEIAKKKNKKSIIWLTGDKSKHDKIERDLIQGNGFMRKNRIEKWEAYPNYFVSDHWI